jgi:HAD superfamily hydrolase (TIGR01549 family)
MIKPKALILDLDGTLFDSNRIYSEALKACGINPEGNPFLSARSQVKKRLSGHTSARNRLLYFKEMLSAEGTYSPESLLQLIEAYEKALIELIRKEWITLHREALLGRIVQKYPIVLLTNENTRTQILKVSAIDPKATYFKHLITSEELGSEKPASVMFQAALKLLNLEPAECAMIGDSFSDDILPALKLGMNAIWTTEFFTPEASEVDAALKTKVFRVTQLSKLDTVLAL